MCYNIRFDYSTIDCSNKLLILNPGKAKGAYTLLAVSKGDKRAFNKQTIAKMPAILKILKHSDTVIEGSKCRIASVAKRLTVASTKHNNRAIRRIAAFIFPKFVLEWLRFPCLIAYKPIAKQELNLKVKSSITSFSTIEKRKIPRDPQESLIEEAPKGEQMPHLAESDVLQDSISKTNLEMPQAAPLEESGSATQSEAPIPLTTKANPLRQIENFAKTQLDENDLHSLSQALNGCLAKLLKGALNKDEKDNLHKQLATLKAAHSSSWGDSTYIIIGESDKENSFSFPPQIKSLLNYTMNVIKSAAPLDVINSPYYHSGLLGDTIADPDRRQKMIVQHCASITSQAAVKDPANVHYLLRDSSTHSGPPGINTFTVSLSFYAGDPKQLNATNSRFAFNYHTRKWQLAMIGQSYDKLSDMIWLEEKSHPCFIAFLKANYADKITLDDEGNVLNRFNSLDDLLQIALRYYSGNKSGSIIGIPSAQLKQKKGI